METQTVYRRAELIRACGEDKVRREVAARRWRSLGQVIVVHNGPLASAEKLAVGVLSAPVGRAAVDRRSVLHQLGVSDEPKQPEIALAVGARLPKLTGVSFSWVSALDKKIVQTEWLARLGAGHALLRAVAELDSERDARALVARALQRKAVSAAGIREALGPTPRLRHSALVREVLTDFEGGIQSLPEKEFAVLCRRAGFPEPARQRAVRGRDGRYYLDADFSQFGCAAEVHGWQHWEFAHREADNWRTADIVAGGLRILVFSSWAVRRQADRVARVLHRALRTGGWRG